MIRYLIVTTLLFGLIAVSQIPNHNAVLITGDTPEGAQLKVEQSIENGDTNIGLWGLVQYKSTKSPGYYNSFWNDTYLMWELLWKNVWNAWPNSNIHVLYGYGEDWPNCLNPRYQAPEEQGIYHITDRSAYYTDVEDIFSDLANGDPGAGIVPMDSDDNLFVFTFNHGTGPTRYPVLDSDLNEISATMTPYRGLEEFIVDSLGLNYVALKYYGIAVLDISDPYNPHQVGRYRTPGNPNDILVDGNYAYVADKYGGVRILDISDPTQIEEVGFYKPQDILMLTIDHTYKDTLHLLAVMAYCGDVHWVNISNPENPTCYSIAQSPITPSGKRGIATKGTKAICCWQEDGIGVADFDTVIPAYDWENSSAQDICINGNLAYIADGENGLTILDISNLDSIYIVSNVGQVLNKIAVNAYFESDTVYLAYITEGEWKWNGEMKVVDVSNPSEPIIVNTYYPPNNRDVTDVEKSGNFLFATTEGITDPNTGLCLMEWAILDSDFASLVDCITTKKRIFWMQQCFSGGFIDDLEGNNSIVSTACKYNEYGHIADDYVLVLDTAKGWVIGVENEEDSVTHEKNYHGEYNFHIMNAVREVKIWPYDDPPEVYADYNSNRGVSMSECNTYVLGHDSWIGGSPGCPYSEETPQFNNLGNIASSTYLEWDDLLPPAVPEGFIYRYKRETDTVWGIKLLWEDNDEVDISGYNIYRNGSFLSKTYKDTTYIDYDIDNYWGNSILYSLKAFDLRDRESSKSDLSLIIPITISNTSFSTAYNNTKRLLSYEESIYSLYRSNNKVYCVVSNDNGSDWQSPELVSNPQYTTGSPAGGVTNDGDVVAVWVRGNNKLVYSIRDNGIWSDPTEIQVFLPALGLQIHSLRNPAIAVSQDTCYIYISSIWRYTGIGSRYYTKWLYGKFDIDNPYPAWKVIDNKTGMISTTTTITLKNKIPLLSYDKNNEILYTQPVNDIWYKWNISNSSGRFSKKPNIDYSSGYANLVWVEESAPSSGIPMIECVSIVPTTDSTLNYDFIPFKERPYNAEEPFVITKQWLYWEEEDDFGRWEIKRSCYDHELFEWDYPEDVSEINWADALYPQALFYRPRVDDNYVLYRVIASTWSEGETPDIGVQERDEKIWDFIFASSNLGQEISSPYEVQREGNLDFSASSQPYEIVDYHPQELIYKIDELNPDLRYRIKLGFFQRSDSKWSQSIEADGTYLGEIWLNSGEVTWFESEIPIENVKDGEITIKVIKETGDYAICGVLYLYEYAENNKKSASTMKTISTETINEFYVKPISCGIMGLEIGLPENCKVELRIYDITGRCVSIPINDFIESGIHKINIKGLSSGVYFYNLRVDKEQYSGKILNIR